MAFHFGEKINMRVGVALQPGEKINMRVGGGFSFGEKINMRVGVALQPSEKEAAVAEDWCDAEVLFADWQLAECSKYTQIYLQGYRYMQ